MKLVIERTLKWKWNHCCHARRTPRYLTQNLTNPSSPSPWKYLLHWPSWQYRSRSSSEWDWKVMSAMSVAILSWPFSGRSISIQDQQALCRRDCCDWWMLAYHDGCDRFWLCLWPKWRNNPLLWIRQNLCSQNPREFIHTKLAPSWLLQETVL